MPITILIGIQTGKDKGEWRRVIFVGISKHFPELIETSARSSKNVKESQAKEVKMHLYLVNIMVEIQDKKNKKILKAASKMTDFLQIRNKPQTHSLLHNFSFLYECLFFLSLFGG